MNTKDKKGIYPTKEEILKCEIIPTQHDIEITKQWKKYIWIKKIKTKSNDNKILEIKILLEILINHRKKNTKIIFNPHLPSACYSPKNDIISLNNHSIITALHELGHAIYGNSELKACSWSTRLFKASFPKTFKKLEWKDHMLIKKPNKISTDNALV